MKHKRILCSASVVAIACLAAGECVAQTSGNGASARLISPATNAPSPVVRQKVAEEYGKLPLSFEANHGQTDPKVKFLSRGPGYKLFLLPNEAVLTLERERQLKRRAKRLGTLPGFPEAPDREASPPEIISMSLVGAAANAAVTGVEQMPGKSNYFIGNDPSQWRTNVPNYAKVHYQGVYPGIDLVYHGSGQQLEYDFIVAPGADPRQIRLGLNGVKKLELTPEGDLLLGTSAEPARLHKPVVYQELEGKRRPIDGKFVLTAKNTVKFSIGKYDRSQPLIIDPVLAYSTLLGGNGFDQAFGIAVDSTGAYVTGSTTSTNFATLGAFQTTLSNCGTPTAFSACEEAFVAKLNSAGNALVYVTYLGGIGFTEGTGIAVFGGNAYVTGETTVTNFPTFPIPGAFQPTLKGGENAFVTELNGTGAALVFSTYLGGSRDEFFDLNGGSPIAVDPVGNVYVTGITTSGDFPTFSAFQTDPGGGTFVSADGSVTWTASNSGLTSRNISAFAVDPTVPTTHTVYAGTSGQGLFKSTSGGQSWVPANGSAPTALGTSFVQTVVIDPHTPTTLYVGSGNGVFKSTDGGTTWAAVNTGLMNPNTTFVANVQTLAIDPTTTGTAAILYAGGFDGAFKTTNGGATWTSLNAGFPLTNGLPTTPEINSIVVDPVTPATVYASTFFQGVFKSTNGGTTWTAASNGLTFSNSSSFVDITALAIDAKAPSNVYASSFSGVYKTANGGSTWTAVGTGLTDPSTRAIVTDPNVSGTAYVGTESTGVFKTIDGGAHWTTATNALSNFIVGALAVDPVTPANVYAGSSVERIFAAKFSASGTIGYSTYLGGSSLEFGSAIAADSQGSAYITGSTESRNFPTANAFQGTRQSSFDAFVTKLNPSGTGLVYSTYLDGANGFSEGFGIAVDTLGSAYVTGIAFGSNFPTTTGAFQTTNGGDSAFVTKFSPAGNTLAYSTFLGAPAGTGTFAFDEGRGIAVDANGNAWVTGFTDDPNFPVVNPIRSSAPCEPTLTSFCLFSSFVSEISPTGSSLLFSTYLAPNDFFIQGGIALDPQGNAYLAGNTSSPNFPILNPLPGSPAPGAGSHGFVSKIATTAVSTDLAITLSHAPDPVTIGNNITFQSTITNNGPNTATGVTFYPTQVPNSTVHLFKTLSSSTPTPSATQGTCDSTEFCSIGTLASGASATVTLVVSTFTGQEGTQTVAVGVGGNESDPIPTNNVASTTVNVLGAVDLRLNGTASPAPVVVGSSLTYTLVVTNNGPSPATGVTLTDTLPAGVTFVSAIPSQGTPCTGTTTVACALGNLAVGATATVTIVVTAPSAVPAGGTITNNSIVTANETITNTGRNQLQQVSDVIAGVGAANPNNAKLNGHYAFLFNGFDAGGAMALAGSFVADGAGNLTGGIADSNRASGVTTFGFTGSVSVGSDNRGTMTFTLSGTAVGITFTYRFALGALNAQGVATKLRFIEFDTSGTHGAGVIERQDPTAFSMAAINGNFAFSGSGEDINHNHFGAAGRFTADGAGNITGGLEDADTAGTLSTNLTFTGTYNIPTGSQDGRGTFTDTFAGVAVQVVHGAFYVVSANESFSINTDPRSATMVLSSGQNLRQRTATFANAWLNGNSVFYASGAPTTGGTDVTVGVATADGLGNITTLSDENNAGNLSLNHTGSATSYSVAANGRTTFTGGTGTQPIAYLVDLNRGFLVDTGTTASSGTIEPQAGGPFTNASISGNYFFGDTGLLALNSSSTEGVATADGAGNLAFTQDHASTLIADEALTATYLVPPNGRTPLNVIGGDSVTLYVISPTKAVAIGTKSGSTNDRVTLIESATLPTTTADLAITKTASVTLATIGEQFFYNLTVRNNGPGLATGVVVTDPLPASVTFALASASQGACTQSVPVVCSLGGIPNGASVDISIVVTAAAAGAAQNTATVTGNETDPNLTNNSSSVTVTINSAADLALVATATPDSVTFGSNLTFTVTATNVGNLAASNVVITDTLPANVTFTPSPNFPCTVALPTVTCSVASLAAGASFTATMAVTPTTTGTFTNTATVVPAGDGPNTASASATVLPSATAGTVERYFLTDRNSPTVLEFDPASTSPTPPSLGAIHAGSTPHEIAISPNGRLAFVGDANSNFVSVIDLTLGAEINRIHGVRASGHVALNGDGTKLVVPNLNLDEVDIIDTSTFQIQRVSINGLVGDDPNNPNDILKAGVVTAGNFAYIDTEVNNFITAPTPARVAVIDLTALTASSIPGTDVGFVALRDQIAATPDGKFVIVPRRGTGGQLLIIDATRNTLSQTVSAPGAPFAIAITRDANDPAGVFGYVTRGGNLNTVSVLDLRPGSPTFLQFITGGQVTLPPPSGGSPGFLNQSHIGITADGKRLIVAAFNPTATQNNVFVLDTGLLRSNPTGQSVIVSQFRAGGALPNLDGVGVGLVQSQPPVNAPVVTAVSTTPVTTPSSIVNDVANTVHITGRGFATGAFVRVGSLDPIAAANVTSTGTDLDVMLPQFVPAQNAADIIVTNPGTGGVTGQSASGILRGALTINSGTAFQPTNEVTVSTFGDNAVAIFNNATKSVTNVPTSPRPVGEAISVDGLRAYVGSLTNLAAPAVNVINLNTKTLDATIALAADTFALGQVDAIVTAPNPATGGPVEFLLTGYRIATTGLGDLRVVLIDSDSTSPTFNTIVGSFAAGLTTDAFPGALGVTSDGHFAYANDANTGNLVIINILSGATTVIPASAQSNPSPFQPHIEITQDNKSLVLLSNPGALLVFDIGANPISPKLVATITGTTPTGLSAPSYGNFRVVGNHVFAYDPAQNVVQAFNFDRTANNFAQVASFVVPGNLGMFAPGLAVTPDGSLLYLTLEGDDAIAVIDNVKFLAGNPSPLITKLRVGLTPSAIIISPGQALIANLAITKTPSVATVVLGTTVTYTMAVTNSGPSSSTGVVVTDVLPAGLTFVSATPSQGTCTFNANTATVSCSLGTLANGATASISLTATVTSKVPTIVNTATVAENETNPTPANATASATINVTSSTACGSVASIQWTGVVGDGLWTDAKNWNLSRVPVAADDVCIDTPFAGTTVTLSGIQSVHSLNAASSFVISGATAPASLTLAADSTFLNALTLNGATLSSAGKLTLGGLLTSSGTSSMGGATGVTANAGFMVSGTLTITGTTLANFGPGALNSGSTLQLSGGATLDNNSSLHLSLARILTSSGSSVINRAGATINVTPGDSFGSLVAAPFTNLGTVSVSNNGVLSLTGGYTQTSGVTALSTGGSISTSSPLNINGGLLVGTGTITGGVTVATGGTTSPGFSPGTINVSGVYTQTVTGTYKAEIGGLTAGTQYDQIIGTGTGAAASLSGTLNVSLINGFVPVAGNSFTILTCSGSPTCRTGTFTAVNLPALPSGLGWSVAYTPTSVVLSVTATGCATGTNQWTGGAGDSQWGTAANWTGGVPGASDNVCIGSSVPGGTLTVTVGSLVAANQTIASLNSSIEIDVTAGPLTVTGPATFLTALFLDGGTLTLNGTSSIQGALNLNSGTLGGTGTLTVTGSVNWGGTIRGAGTLNAKGGMSISGSVFLDAHQINVSGATSFGNADQGGTLLLQNGAVINNLAGATWSIRNGNSTSNGIILNGATTGTFNNVGTFQMTGGTSDTVSVPFNNTGTVNANAGTLNFTGGGVCGGACAGAWSAGTGATLGFGGGTFALSGSITGVGTGTVVFSNGTANLTGTYNVPGGTTVSGGTANFTGTSTSSGALTISGGTANFSNTGGAVTTSALTFSGGTLTGTSAVTVSGLLNWSGGTMSGTGATNANAGMSFTSPQSFLDARTLNVSGTTTFGSTTAGATLFLQNGGVINNVSGATWSIVNANGNGIFLNGATVGTFNNAGTLQGTGGPGFTIGAAFNNTGTVNLNVGTLIFSGGGSCATTCSGSFNVASGTTLNFSGGTFALSGSIAGAGAVDFSGATANLSGTYNITGQTVVAGGTANFIGTLTAAGTLGISAGTANFSNVGGAVTTSALTFTGGTLTGTAAVTVSGLLSWSGGTMSGTGVTNANGGMSFTSGQAFLDTRTLNTSGTTTFGTTTAGANLFLQNGGVINNLAGATWSLVNSNGIALNGATTGTFNNMGTFQVTGGVSSNVSVVFNNSGTVNVNTGTLNFTDGGTEAGGFNASAGATLNFSSGTFNFNAGSSVSGAGTASFSATAVNFNASSTLGTATNNIISGTVTLAPGTTETLASLNLSGGTLTGAGTLTITGLFTWTGGTMSGAGVTNANGGMSIPSGQPFLDTRILNVSGATAFATTSVLLVQNGAVINNPAGSTWTMSGGGSIQLNGATTGAFNNAGTFQMTGGASSTVGMAFNNTGTVAVTAGTLTFSNGGTEAGGFTAASGTTLGFSSGTYNFNVGSSVTGAGTASFSATAVNFNASSNLSVATTNISSGTVTLATGTTVTLAALNQSGGTLTGTGILTLTGLLTWTGGTMTGTGATNANGGMSIPSGQPFLDTRMLNVSGTTAFATTSDLLVQNGAVINNLAGSTWTVTNASGNGIILNGATAGTFNNAGTFTATGAGNSTVGTTFNNTGTVNVNGGTLAFGGGGTVGAGYNVSAGATLAFNSRTFNFNAGTAITGAGTTSLATTVNVNGNAGIATPVSITAGTTTLASGVTLTLSSLTLNATLTGAGNVTVSGLLTWTGGTMSGTGATFANGGMSLPSASVSLDTRTLNVSGVTTFGNATGGSNLLVGNGAVINNLAGATWSIVNGNGNGLLLNGATAGMFNNSGTFQMTGGISNNIGVVFNNTGTVGANAGTLSFGGTYTQTGSASVTRVNGGKISSTSLLTIQGGTLLGIDGATPPGILADISNPGGVVHPGLSPGLLSTSGLYTQGAAGSFNVDIGGTTVGAGYSHFHADTAIALGGALNVTLINGFTPAVGNSFTIIDCGTTPTGCLTGTFATTNLPTLPGGLVWKVTYNPTSVVLTVNVVTAGCTAGNNQWTGAAGDSQWGNAANWTGGVPGASDNVCIGTAFTSSTITIGALAAANQTIASLVADSTINVASGPLTVTGAATFANVLNISSGGTLTLNGASTVQFATNLSGTLSGAGNVTLTGKLTWNLGAMTGTGTTTANGGMAISFGGGSPSLGRMLINGGAATFNTVNFGITAGGTFVNNTGSTIDIQSDSVSLGGGGNTGTVRNMGTIMKSAGTGGSSIDVNLNSAGSILVNSGTLTIDTVNNLTSAVISGTATVAANATLNFNGVSATVSGGVSGAGSVSASRSTVTVTGAYNITGTTTLATVSTTVNFNGATGNIGPVTALNGSVVNFNAPGTVAGIGVVTISGSTANFASSTANINLAGLNITQGGVLTGSNNLTIAGASSLNQGTINGTGAITANGPVAFNVPPFNFPLVLDGRTFTANAGVTMTSTAPVQLQNGAVFVNSAASLFDIQGPAGITFGGGTAVAFNNFGTLQRSTGTSSVPVAVAFNNSGTVNANAGTLSFTGSFTQTSGATVLNGGGIASGTQLNINGGSLTGTGTITGNVSNASGTIFGPSFATGVINLAGNYTQGGAGSYFAGIGGLTAGTQYDQLNLTGAGTATLGGTLNVSLLGTFVPATGNSFTILTCAATTACINGTFGATNLPPPPSGLVWHVTYNANSVVLSVGPPPVIHLAVTAPATATAGAAFNYTVTAQDANNNTVTSYAGTVQFSTSDPLAMLPANATLTNGTGTFAATLKTAGSQRITATDIVTSSITGTSSAIAVNPAATSKLAFSQQPSTTTAGQPIAPAVTVQVQDPFGNVVTADTSNVSIAISSGGVLSAGSTTTVAAAAGVATFINLVPTKPGTFTLSVSDGALTGANSSNFTVNLAAASKLAFSQQPSTTTAGQAIAPAVTVQVQDPFGNVVTTDTSNVSIAISSGGVLSAGSTTTVAAVAGVATFISLVPTKAGTFILSASDGTLTGATSSNFTVSATTASKLVLTTAVQTLTAGVCSSAITVQSQDSLGNPTNPASAETLALASSSSGGTFYSDSTCTTAITAASIPATTNMATFFYKDTKVGSPAITVTGSVAFSATVSQTETVSPGTATQLAFTVQPSSVTAGAAIAPPVQVAVEDSLGNVITTATNMVTVALGANASGGTLSGTTTVAAMNGVATFSNLSINNAGAYTLAASSALLTSATSTVFNVTSGTASKLAFTVQPTNVTAGSVMTPSVQVTVQDARGNTVTSATTSITIAIGTNPSSGTLSGTLTQSAVAGVATFPGLSINKAGNGYTVTASAPAPITGATSTAFNVTAGAATQLAISAPTTATAGASFNFTVTAQDALNNTVPGYTGTVRFTSSDTQAVLPANSTLTNGTGTFAATLKTAGSQTITATDTVTATIAGTSNAITVSTGAATHFAVTAPATATAGTSFNVTVTAEDALNNTVTSYAGMVHFTSSDAQAVLPANTTLTNGTGTFAATLKTVGSPTITATDTANAEITGTSNAIAVSPGTATHFAVTAPGTATAGTPLNFTVTALDQFNNLATGYTGTVRFTSSDTQAVLPANTTLTNGAGTFPATLKMAGSQTITATDTVTATITGTSNAITVNAGTAAHFAISAPTTATAGTSFNYTVTAQDALNNTVTGYTGTVHFTSSDLQAVLPGNTTLTNGVGTFPATLKTVGNQTITATDTVTATIAGTSSAITVSTATATHFQVSAPATATAGVAINYTVTALDQFNNAATGYTGTVHFTSSDLQAVLPGNTTLTNGVGTFPATLKTLGSQTITVTDTVTVTITGTSNAIVVSAGRAAHFAISAPTTATAGTSFNYTVTAQDALNNTVTGYTGTVHFTSSDAQAVLPANTTLTNGTGTFQATLKTAGSQTISATDIVNEIAGTSNAITVNPPVATHFAVTAPATATQGVAFNFTVTALDLFNSVVTGYAGTVHFSSSDAQAVLPANSTLTNGTGTFAATLKTIGSQTITATDTVIVNEITGTSNAITVSTGGLPTVTLSTTSLSFASQPVGTPSTTQQVTLMNSSSALPLTNLSIAASGDFAQTNNCGTGLAAQSSCMISVTFTPTATGTRMGAITITDNATGSPQSVSLTGIGINAPAITLNPGSLIFSSRLVGSSSPAQAISMSNSGNATLNIASIAITGSNAGDFSQTNTCGQTLAPSVSCTISVIFKPTASGQRTAGVAITSDARGSVPVVTLSGTGLAVGLDLSTTLLIFDNQTVGTTSAPQTVTLSNSGATAVAITSITANGDYAQTNNCGSSLAASSNCAIRVTFSPTATGTRTGSISIASSDSTTPLTVNLTGTGVVVTLSLSTSSLPFNNQGVGTSSQAQNIILTNTGSGVLAIDSIVPSGDFAISNASTCPVAPATLPAGAKPCIISVTFTPTAAGTRNGAITITSNAQGSPHTVNLTGNGVTATVSVTCTMGVMPVVTVSCNPLTFSAQAVGTPSTAQNVVVILKNVGTDTLNIASIAITGTNAGDFVASNACALPPAATLAAGMSCSTAVTFTPTDKGPRSGTLIITDNSGNVAGSTQTVSLSGTGTASAVSLSSSAVAFGNQLLNSTSSPAQMVTLTNTGSAALTITSIKASGDFAETSTGASACPISPVTLAAGGNCMISLTFTPTAVGPRAGAITISDNASDSPQSITLSGNGTDIIISVLQGGSTSATVTAGQTATFQLLVSPAGGFSDTVTISCNSAIPASNCSPPPTSVMLNAPMTVTTTVTTTAPSPTSTALPVPWLLPRNFGPLRAVTQVLLLFVALLVFVVSARRRRAWISVTAALFLAALASGCAGGYRNPGVVGPTLGTPANTYTITFVVKTTSGATRSFPLTVIVK